MRIFLLLVLAVAIAAAGCAIPRPASQSAAGHSYTVSDARGLRRAFGREVRRLLLARDYDQLEQMAAELRASKARFGNGRWKLHHFYLDGFSLWNEDQTERSWARLVKEARAWSEARPRSITAPVALAYALTGHAWYARGGGYGYTVSDEGWNLMRLRLREARSALEVANALPERCPGWWEAAQRVALGQGWSRQEYDSLLSEAIARHPDYDGYFRQGAQYYMPRWYGAEGEWEALADASTRQLPQPECDVMYAHVVWSQLGYYGNIFTESAASWERTRAGFQAMLERDTVSLEIKSAYCELAVAAGDRETARALFAQLGNRIELSVWRSVNRFYEKRSWALARPA